MKLLEIPSGMETEAFAMSRGALNDIPVLLEKYFPGKRVWIVADENTWEAAGKRLFPLLNNPYPPEIFPGTPMLHPDSRYADELAEIMPADCVPLAVGSGVINDLVKRASGIASVRYCCVPTAASVDGYTSFGASLSVEQLKKTMPCPAPYAIVADIDVLESAPPEMLSGGYADLAAKIPAGADWIIADKLGLEPIVPSIWNLVQKNLRKWISDCHNLENIFEGLAATGYSMQLYRESRPASGAEHLFSHVWEMEGLCFMNKDVSHGFKVAIGTLASTLLMEFVINTDVAEAMKLAIPGISKDERKKEIAGLLKLNCYGEGTENIAMSKFSEGDELLLRREKIWSIWNELRTKLAKQLLPFEDLRSLLKKASCPIHPNEIGLSAEQFYHAIPTAQLIRKRYTIPDFLYDAGLLEAASKNLNKMF